MKSQLTKASSIGMLMLIAGLLLASTASLFATFSWYWDDELKQFALQYLDEDHSCTPPPDGCCAPPGPGGSGGGGPGGGPPGGGPPGGGCSSGRCGVGAGSGDTPVSNPGSGGNGVGYGAPGSPGMARWWVSEPSINLWLEDTPYFYQPARGPRVELKLSLKEKYGPMNKRDFNQSDAFGFGLGWHTPWRSFIQPNGGNTAAMVVFGDGAVEEVPMGGAADYHRQTTLELVSTNYVLTFPWGARNIYNYSVSGPGGNTYFLSEMADASGNSIRFEYYQTNGWVRLNKVIDAEGLETTFTYTGAYYRSNLIATVTGPHGAGAQFQYDEWARLTNIVDMIGLNSQFGYSTVNTNWNAYQVGLDRMITPYGTNTFTKFGSWTYENQARSVAVNEMGTRNHYFAYEPSCSFVTNDLSSEVPSVPAFMNQTFDSAGSDLRNSFYWVPRQFDQISEPARSNILAGVAPTTLTNQDYLISRQRHWLLSPPSGLYTKGSAPNYASTSLSFERQPSPNGIQAGHLIWYDYPKTGSNNFEGTQYLPKLVAWKLPNGETHLTYSERNDYGHETNRVESYSGGPGLRTNVFEYAANGIDMTRHLSVLAASSHVVVSNIFNANHQVTTSYNALNEATTYTYDGSNRLATVTRPTGWKTINGYDANGRLASVIDMDVNLSVYFRTNSYTYTNGLLWTHTDPRGLKLTYEHDLLQRITAIFHPDGTSNSFTFDKLDLVRTLDRMGFTNRMEYNSLRETVRRVDALERTNTYNYCSCGSLDSVVDPLGQTTSFTYDNLGRRLTTTFPDSFKTTNVFDLPGRLVLQSDSTGKAVTNHYNNQGLRFASSSGFDYYSYVAFDMEDQIIQQIDQNKVVITNRYDDLHRLVERGHSAGGAPEQFIYSELGLVAHVDQLNNTNLYYYDAMHRKTQETNAWEAAIFAYTEFTYGPAGDLLTLKDGKTQNTNWKYDSYGRVTNKVDHYGSNLFIYTYDPNSRLTSRWTPEKGTTWYTNDAVGNLTTINYPSSADITLAYDKLNRLTNMLDAVGGTAYTYNSIGQLLGEDGPWENDAVNYSYSQRRRSNLSLAQPVGAAWTQSYAYDAINRLTNTTSAAGAFGYHYDSVDSDPAPAQLVTLLTLPNGSVISNAFDHRGRLLDTTLSNSTATVLNRHAYQYDDAHRRTRQTRTDGSYTDYSYDGIGQLIGAAGQEPGGSTNRLHEKLGYRYDAVGGLVQRTNNAFVKTFRLNKLNQLTNAIRSGTYTVAGHTHGPATSVTVNGSAAERYADGTYARAGITLSNGTNTFTAVGTDASGRGDTNVASVYLPSTNTFAYDWNGNLVTNTTRKFEYDDENQLTRITEPGVWKAEFVYDGKFRMRVSRDYTWRNGTWVLTNEVRRVLDGMLVLQERDQFNVPRLTYTRGKDLSGSLEGAGGIGGLLALSEMSNLSSPIHSYYHADGNGNVTALVDTNQQVVARYLYDPFGNTLSATGPKAALNKYRFSSKEWHGPSGMVYYGYRWYVPELSRWLNRDPIGEWGGVNLHGFIGNDPLNVVDTFGLAVGGRGGNGGPKPDKGPKPDRGPRWPQKNPPRDIPPGPQGDLNEQDELGDPTSIVDLNRGAAALGTLTGKIIVGCLKGFGPPPPPIPPPGLPETGCSICPLNRPVMFIVN